MYVCLVQYPQRPFRNESNELPQQNYSYESNKTTHVKLLVQSYSYEATHTKEVQLIFGENGK